VRRYRLAALWKLRFRNEQHRAAAGSLAFHFYATFQRSQRIWRWHAFYLYQIGFRMVELWVGQAVRHITIIGEQQQPFAILIQPAGRVNSRNVNVRL